MAPSAAQALGILRDTSHFEWYVIPFLLTAVYVYAVEIGRMNWNAVCAGLAFWAMDWHAEIWNAVIFHASGYAPLWGTPGRTAFEVLIGLNIEISLMFLIMGMAAVKMLPDRDLRIFGIPNRIFFAVTLAALCVAVEMVLNAIGALTWEYWWWSTSFPLLIFGVAYLPCFILTYWIHDLEDDRKRFTVTAGIYAWVGLLALIFGAGLGWI